VSVSVAVERFFPDKPLRRASVGPAIQKAAESAKKEPDSARSLGNESITFSGRNKTLVLPIAVHGPRMLVWSH
jgi:hypothetical protein